jgi:hypothetical protein
MAGQVKQPHYLIASLAVFDRSLRSLRCSLGSRRLRRIRRNDCFGRTGFVLDTFRRLLLQIGGANIGARGSRLVAAYFVVAGRRKSMSAHSSSAQRHRSGLIAALAALAPRGSRLVAAYFVVVRRR